jgi:hypothetical protein
MLGFAPISALPISGLPVVAAPVVADAFIVTPGRRFAQPSRGETEEQKRKRRIAQGIIQEDEPAPRPVKVKPDPLAEQHLAVLQASVDEARAANALARQYIAKLNAQINAKELARQQTAKHEAKRLADAEEQDILYVAAVLATM